MRLRVRMRSNSSGGAGCLIIVALVVGGLAVGGLCFDYSLYSITGLDAPWYMDVIAAPLTGEMVVPVAVVCWVVRSCGVEAPFWDLRPPIH